MLAAPAPPTVAVSRKQWRELSKTARIEPALADDPDVIEVEVWTYDPFLFATNNLVDRLSLFLSLKDNADERVQLSLREMMENVEWS